MPVILHDPTFVYLIEAEIGVVKVGCSTDPLRRLRGISTHSPCPVRLIAQWPGSLADEAVIHRAFSEYRGHNEWFRVDGRFLAFVVERTGFGVDHIPEWSSLVFASSADRKRLGRIKASATRRANREVA